MQTSSVRPNHITRRRTDFQHSVPFFFCREKCLHYGNHTLEAVFARVSKTDAIKFYFLRWIHVSFMCGLTCDSTQKITVFVKCTTSINKFYYQQFAGQTELIGICMRLLRHVSVISFSYLQGALIYQGYITVRILDRPEKACKIWPKPLTIYIYIYIYISFVYQFSWKMAIRNTGICWH